MEIPHANKYSNKKKNKNYSNRGRRSPQNNQNNQDGCFIATAVYSNYDHPDVLVLRKFRDIYLRKSEAGRWFIKTYYFYSPPIASWLSNNVFWKKFLKPILHILVCCFCLLPKINRED